MYNAYYFDSVGGGKVCARLWVPETQPKAIVQIIHGIAEHVTRYDQFARYLNEMGYMVVAEDHMGHGNSITEEVPQGYFAGGWDAAVEDCCSLMRNTMAQYPDVPYILFGHSMGSFLARSILIKHPDSGIHRFQFHFLHAGQVSGQRHCRCRHLRQRMDAGTGNSGW